MIPLRLRTDRSSGTIISDWDFEPPWQTMLINWDYEPEDVIPEKHQDVYKHLFKSRLRGVLNGGLLIRRGGPVEGVLCGRSFQPIGESSHGAIRAELSLTDDLGNTVPLCIDLNVYRHRYSSASRLPGREAGHGLFRHVDSGDRFDPSAFPAGPGSESESLRGDAVTARALDQGGKPEEALPVWRKMPEMAEAIGDAETIQTVRTELTDAVQ